MKYPDKTKLKILSEYAVHALKSHQVNVKVGMILTATYVYGGTYTLDEITELPDGWSEDFVEDPKHFGLAEITNWRERL